MTFAQAQEFRNLHREALAISKELSHQEFLMIEILQKIDKNKIYRFLKFKSLYQYAIVALRLSEHRAYSFITVARKAAQISKLQEALKNKELTLSRAKRISSVIDNDSADKWIKLGKNLSQRGLERAVATVNPKSQVLEGTRFISEDTLEFKAAVSLDTEQLVRRAQDLLCQSEGKAVSFDETLKAMAKIFLEKKDPVVRAARILKKKMVIEAKENQTLVTAPQKDSSLCTVSIKNSSQRRVEQKQTFKRAALSQDLKHKIFLRDQGQCQAQNPRGEKCKDERWIDIHHKIPVSRGGLNTTENLVTLCRSHHEMVHG